VLGAPAAQPESSSAPSAPTTIRVRPRLGRLRLVNALLIGDLRAVMAGRAVCSLEGPASVPVPCCAVSFWSRACGAVLMGLWCLRALPFAGVAGAARGQRSAGVQL